MSSAWTDETGADSVDTIELLQEEISRLEAELRRLEEVARQEPPEPGGGPASADFDRRIGDLAAALTERDETIGLLCEQLAALEEVGAARAAEWEQMDRWVRELEARIEREGSRSPDPEGPAFRDEALREQLTCRERAWEAERTHFEQEIAELRSRQAEAAGRAGDSDRAQLEAENQRLRYEGRRLAAVEAEAEAIRERTTDLEGQLGKALLNLGRAEDDLRRRCFEHEAELAALRTGLASAKATAPAELNADERLRAFRLHLREVHEREEREREERQLINRISRLWRRPGSQG